MDNKNKNPDNVVPGHIQAERQNNADNKQRKERLILSILHCASLQGKHKRAR